MSYAYFSTVRNTTYSGNNWLNFANAENAPDGVYTSCALPGLASPISLVYWTDYLNFYSWQGVAIPLTAIITSVKVSLFGHCSNPNILETYYIYLYTNGVDVSYPLTFNNSSIFSLMSDAWTADIDITNLFTLNAQPLTPAQLNNGLTGFTVQTSQPFPSTFSNTTYIDSGRMIVNYSLFFDSPVYSRKRRRFKMRRNHQTKIISQQTRLKGLAA